MHTPIRRWVRRAGAALWLAGAGWAAAETNTVSAAPDPEPLRTLRALARPVADAADLDPLLERMAGARLVLLGEASHGTAEFYTWRDTISRRLIAERDFRFVVVEGDWANCYRLNRYVKDLPGAADDARAIMRSFSRWPTWMWANTETLTLIEWLRAHNRERPMADRVGFYGMDVYGDAEAREKVLRHMAAFDADLAEEARAAYAPFDAYGGDPGRYARALRLGAAPLDGPLDAVSRLIETHAELWRARDPVAYFHLQQSALVAQNAERHFRAMLTEGPDSWNFRVAHFDHTVQRLLDFYGPDARGIVWAHNTHIGDARATPMAASGQTNIGQLTRDRWGREAVFALGFGTHTGAVLAGRRWGGPRETLNIPPAQPDSYEAWMQQLGMDRVLFLFEPGAEAEAALGHPLGHRAIGVVYNPEYEHLGNYVPTRLNERYDAFFFFSATTPLNAVDIDP